MKRFMTMVLVTLMSLGFMGGFAGCKEEKVTPPAEEKMGGDYSLPSPEAERVTPPVEEATPKGEEPETAASGDIMGGGKKEWLKGDVRAGTLPMARFNWIANRICVVWHEREQPGTNLTDVYYTAKGPSGWLSHKVRINDVQTNDQFMPALDFEVSGRIKVVFYDRRDDASNLRYHLYTAYITSNGTLVRSNGRLKHFFVRSTIVY